MPSIACNLTCTVCLGDLHGAPLAGACSHCQAPVADTINVSAIGGDGCTLATDTPCVRCEYNLRTMTLESRCPECGTAIVATIRPSTLRFADSKWLRRVRGGFTNLLLALGALALLIIFIMVMQSQSVVPAPLVMAFGIALGGFTLVIGAFGILRVTLREPTLALVRQREYVRPLARWGILAPLAFLVLGTPLAFLIPMTLFLGWLVPLLFLAGIVCFFIHLARLARRECRRLLVRGVTVLGIVVLLAMSLAIASTVLETLSFTLTTVPGNPYVGAAPYAGTNSVGTAGVAGTTVSYMDWEDNAYYQAAEILGYLLILLVLPTCYLTSAIVFFGCRRMFAQALARAPDIEALE